MRRGKGIWKLNEKREREIKDGKRGRGRGRVK